MITVQISKSFRQQATKAILSIILFVITYMLLMGLSVGLTIACGYGGIKLIAARPSFMTLMAGLGLMSVGIFILFFLVKFIFTKNKTDLSHLTEINKKDEPKLFALISEIVEEVGTQFPKRVYLSSEVNASVFYDSSFWSMFFPVKKNLMLGVGLMNTVTVDEFKAIVAHEFGHFSQRSMKVGSLVYNVNKVIHNMLYENSSYENMITKWAEISGYFSIFMVIGYKIIEGIQWVLKKVYTIVNLNYLALSREMEFHADEVAANVAGPQALATSLLRLEYADYSLNNVINFYGEKVHENIKPATIFPQQHYVMSFWAKEYGVPFKNGLPEISSSVKNRFNKSKLAFEDQWASHPSNEDRINRLEQLNIMKEYTNDNLATSLFTNKVAIEQKITAKLFSNVEYPGNVIDQSLADFEIQYAANHTKNTLPKKFNNYFDDLPLPELDLVSLRQHNLVTYSEDELFSNSQIDVVYDYIGLQNDLRTLNSIASGEVKLKSFDYDGQRYRGSEAGQLVSHLDQKVEATKALIAEHDKKIFYYYLTLAEKNGSLAEYREKYQSCLDYGILYDKLFLLVDEAYKSLKFLNEVTLTEKIFTNLKIVKQKESAIRESASELLNDPTTSKYIHIDDRESLEKYLSQDWVYFIYEKYDDAALGVLFNALQAYNNTINNLLFFKKKEFLDFKAQLTTIPA